MYTYISITRKNLFESSYNVLDRLLLATMIMLRDEGSNPETCPLIFLRRPNATSILLCSA